MVLIPNVLSALIWVQTVYKDMVATVRAKNSGKLKKFQVREKSGNFIFSQGNLE